MMNIKGPYILWDLNLGGGKRNIQQIDGPPPPSSVKNIFIFMQFLAKIMQSSRFLP